MQNGTISNNIKITKQKCVARNIIVIPGVITMKVMRIIASMMESIIIRKISPLKRSQGIM
jgi:hypothetical protein